MPRATLHNSRRTRVASSSVGLVGALAIAGLGPLACAAHHHISEAPPHPIAVEIQNNLARPQELTVFITQDGGALNQRLGTVPGDKIETFRYTPVAWDITYRLVATWGGPPGSSTEDCQCVLVSPRVNVNDPNTGTVVWNMNVNQVRFYDLPEQRQAPAKDTTQAHNLSVSSSVNAGSGER
jgi:hypothetical protein